MSENRHRLGTWDSLIAAVKSRRTLFVSLLSFSSGMPLGLVWFAIPDWMRDIGVDIRVVGIITLAQAPWTFKFLWSPLMDRFVPPFLGRRRGWTAIAQIALFATTLMLAGLGDHPDSPWVVGALALAIAFASATQDIAIDAYAVDVLRPAEQGVAVGARIAVYRFAMFVAGGLSITLAGIYSWPLVNVGLAVLYLPMLLITWKAPDPEEKLAAPRTLRDAVWLPFLGFLSRHRALEILAFVFFYKFADQLAQSLTRPFLIDMGYDAFDRGVALASVGAVATMVGAFFGGAVTTLIGLGPSLWVFGLLQAFSNIGYFILAGSEFSRPLMYGATGFELLTSGMGTGAYSVLLLRMTQKRFSATQYALFTSLFGLPRVLAGPISGFLVDAMGWRIFFLFTITCAIPGLVLLSRFVPIGVREPKFEVRSPSKLRPLSAGQLSIRGMFGGIAGAVTATLLMAALTALKAMRAEAVRFDIMTPLATLLEPASMAGWLQLLGIALFGFTCALLTAAVFAARHGAGAGVAEARVDAS